MNNKPISRKSNIVVQDLENEVLIYDLAINKAFCLNQTSGLVYALCDGTRTVFDISDEMSKRLKNLVSEDFVYLALDELKKNNLLENSEEFTNHFSGMSRREVVKKVGLASMVALPIIASVVAPSALMAQSGPACPMLNQCFPAGTELCAFNPACDGSYSSALFAAGSNCTGPSTGAGAAVCVPASLTLPQDARIISVP